MIKVAVIGSGPSGVACAYSLLKQKDVSVDMLDTGLNIEPKLANLENNETLISSENALKQIKAHKNLLLVENKKLPDKLAFGSNYPYKTCDNTGLTKYDNAHFLSSQAKGGLGNVWGANICALADTDIVNWPISATDLSPYFKMLEEFTPVSAEKSVLDTPYDYKFNGQYGFKTGSQAGYVLDNIANNTYNLSKSNINIARAPLAVGKLQASNGEGCVGCGLCMHGCPYNAIFNPKFTVDQLLVKNSLFNYIKGNLVEKVEETDGGVDILIKNLNLNQNETKRYDRIYIACGSVGSTVLIARSLNWTNHEFTFLDSQKYLFPFLLNKRARGAIGQVNNTLAQICAQTSKLQSSDKTVHLQLYGYNDLIVESLRVRFGDAIHKKLLYMGAPLLERIMIGMVYLHSDDSGQLKMKVEPDIKKGWGSIKGHVNNASRGVYKEFLNNLNNLKVFTGGRAMPFFSITNLPGNSQHFGGSLPMRENPSIYETDPLGRPYKMKYTHVVDTSVFTTVPATPTTYPAMANAARIAKESLKLRN